MPELVSVRTGEVQQFATVDEAQAAIATGEFGLRGDMPTRLVDAQGGVVESDPEDAAGLLLGGDYRLAGEEEVAAELERQEFTDLGSTAGATAEGLAAGATLGLSDAAIQGGLLGDEFAEDSRKRAEHRPEARLAGEAGGIIAASLLSGGTAGAGGLAARGARAATLPARAALGAGRAVEGAVARALPQGEGLLARALSRGAALGAGGAVEGSAFGAGQAMSRALVENEPLTAQKLIAGAGTGALLGFGAGAGLGAGGAVLGAAARTSRDHLLKAVSKESLEAFAEGRAFKAALGGRNLKKVKLAERRHGGVERIGRDLLDEDVVTASSTLDDIAKAADERSKFWGERVGSLVDELDATGARIDSRAVAASIRKSVIDPLKSKAATKRFGEQLEGNFRDVLEALDEADGMGVREFWEQRRALDATINFESLGQSPLLAETRKVRSVMEEAFEEQTDALAGGALGRATFREELQTAKRKYSNMRFAADMTQEALERNAANRFLSPSDYGVGTALAAGESVTRGGVDAGTLAFGAASGLFHKVLRERGSALIAGTLDKAMRARAGQVQQAARATDNAIQKASKGVLERAAGTAKTKARQARQAAPVLGVTFSGPRDTEAGSKLTERIISMADPESEPRQRARRVTGAFGAIQPTFGAETEASVQRAADFLRSKVPAGADTVGEGLFGHLGKPKIDAASMSGLRRYAEAVEHPVGAFERLADGEIRFEDLETLQVVFPDLYRELQAQVTDGLAQVTELPSYRERQRLSLILGVPADQTLSPEFIRASQAAIAERTQHQQNEEPALSPSQRTAPDISRLYESRIDRIAQG